MGLICCHSYIDYFQIAPTTKVYKRTGIMLSERASAAAVPPRFLLQGDEESVEREEAYLGSLFVSALSQTSERYVQ